MEVLLLLAGPSRFSEVATALDTVRPPPFLLNESAVEVAPPGTAAPFALA